jgi:hypothetical protein
MPFNIFVSYSTKDLPQVELLRQQLQSTPISVFVAEHSVLPSEELASKISSAILECDLFVLLWSSNAKESDWVPQEIGRAMALNKSILPLVLTENIALPGFLQGLKYLAIHTNPAESIAKARDIILNAYNTKTKYELQLSEQKEKKDKDALALMGISAFLLWAFSK